MMYIWLTNWVTKVRVINLSHLCQRHQGEPVHFLRWRGSCSIGLDSLIALTACSPAREPSTSTIGRGVLAARTHILGSNVFILSRVSIAATFCSDTALSSPPWYRFTSVGNR